MIAIETHDLRRVYKTYRKPEGLWNSVKGIFNRQYNEKLALDATTLSIESGQIVGLIGANGAGKTTLLKLLSGLIAPSSGTVSVLGYEPWKRQEAFLKKISILLGQKNQLWWDISPVDSYALLARIYDLDLNAARVRVMELAKILQCDHVLETQLRRLSLGERMKMEIIGALLHEPEILFLDEPTIGLDIVAQETIRHFLEKYVRERGPTVILTSHYMDDISLLAKKLLLISKGKIVYQGTVKDMMSTTSIAKQVYVRFSEETKRPIHLTGQEELPAGQKEYHFKVSQEQLGISIAELTSHGAIVDLKLEESDFEDVIKSFLEKESRIR